MLLAREAHFKIDLRELKLAVGAQVLVAEAARDLEVAVEAGDHQNLLEDLRRLRQRVEAARIDAARHKKIARAFRRGLVENRRFDFEEAIRAEALADGAGNLVAQQEVSLHLDAAQVDVAVLEARFLVGNGLFGGRKGREARIVQHA